MLWYSFVWHIAMRFGVSIQMTRWKDVTFRMEFSPAPNKMTDFRYLLVRRCTRVFDVEEREREREFWHGMLPLFSDIRNISLRTVKHYYVGSNPQRRKKQYAGMSFTLCVCVCVNAKCSHLKLFRICNNVCKRVWNRAILSMLKAGAIVWYAHKHTHTVFAVQNYDLILLLFESVPVGCSSQIENDDYRMVRFNF